jgi:protoporphyrinogen oxidase
MRTHYDIVIIGAGLTGLSTGHFLQKAGHTSFVVFEKEQRPGGLCRTEQCGDYLFDYCGHLLHFDSPDMKQLVSGLLRDNLCVHTRNSKIFSHNTLTDYPFQCNLFGLPQPIIIECIESFIYARYENQSGIDTSSFGSWAETTLGKGIARNFMLPYNEKLWAFDPYKLTTEWMKSYVPATNLHHLLTGAFSSNSGSMGYNVHFSYPRKGGIEEFIRALAGSFSSNILNGTEVKQTDPVRKIVTFGDNSTVTYSKLISTVPLKEFVQNASNIPDDIIKANGDLKCSGVVNINIAVKGISFNNISWIYFPEKEFVFYRVGFYSSFAADFCEPGATSLYVEIAYRDTVPDISELYSRTIQKLQHIGIISSENDILEYCMFNIPNAYVTYDRNWKTSRTIIHEWLQEHDIYSIGRYGSWEYSDMEDSMLQARETVRKVLD